MLKFNHKTLMEFMKGFLLFILTLIVISLLTFGLIKLTPGDPAENYLRACHQSINDKSIAFATEKLGLNKPVLVQYTDWLFDIMRGNFGDSYIQGEKIIDIMKRAVIPTMILGSFSFVMLFIISMIFGTISSLNRGKIIDYIVQGISYFSISIPPFWLGYLLIILFAVRLKWVPVSGQDGILNLILPSITLMTPLVGQTSLLIRKAILEEMTKPHVENAIIRGVSQIYIVKNHLLKNVFSSNILYLFTGSILIEEIFSWPGLGKMFVNAVQLGDTPLIQASLMFFGVFAIVVNSITQEIVHRLDPHLKMSKKRYSYEES